MSALRCEGEDAAHLGSSGMRSTTIWVSRAISGASKGSPAPTKAMLTFTRPTCTKTQSTICSGLGSGGPVGVVTRKAKTSSPRASTGVSWKTGVPISPARPRASRFSTIRSR